MPSQPAKQVASTSDVARYTAPADRQSARSAPKNFLAIFQLLENGWLGLAGGVGYWYWKLADCYPHTP